MNNKPTIRRQDTQLKIKAIKKQGFSDLQKLMLPLIVASLVYAIISASV